MNILAIDTSSASGSIALSNDKRLVAELTVSEAGAHAEWLLKSIDSFLSAIGSSISDVDFFAVTNGPGSFTGLRIGVSAVKGLAWSTGKKAVGVSALKALSLNLAYSERPVCPVLDARKGEVYSALFKPSGGVIEEILPETAMTPPALIDALSVLNLPAPPVFIGDGLKAYGDIFKEKVAGASFAHETFWRIRASNIALLAIPECGQDGDPRDLTPVYLRKSEAEIRALADKSK
ncbi:MAG: tRNA (adenosine(37)-N6)-threonylcarbamoyltransferase complex dimerization subunit type 1 TsaB [Deltaproteobacteria bacterium GWB2_55_19]|nr:MAG: tRNA (adenosine(37)-N6)-threonylcarbamoyltransferase complex dimerization subunit type 1 TsaB [Deltaproteobacteria bacterium GWB2_55_19]